MKPVTLVLPCGSQRPHELSTLITRLSSLDAQVEYQITIQTKKEARSLPQLRGLFGNWFAWLANDQGYTVDYLHRWMKAKCLAPLYVYDPQTPTQEQWGELLAKYQEEGNHEKLERHARRISLSWIRTAKQMAQYMEAVYQFWAEQGIILPEMDKFYQIKKKGYDQNH